MKLETDFYYHIYNRAIGNEKLFIDQDEYLLFIIKWRKYLQNYVDLMCYCLVPNHFHVLIKVKSESELEMVIQKKLEDCNKLINQQFSNFFNSYSKSINLKRDRKGKLFMLPYNRKLITDASYLTTIVGYIHRNPIHHYLVKKIGDWRHSSYGKILNNSSYLLNSKLIISWFGNKKAFEDYHEMLVEDFEPVRLPT